jgi:hypothetical protein
MRNCGTVRELVFIMTGFPSERIPTAREHFAGATEGSKRKQQPQQPRQLLSCTKCRERKVKVSDHPRFPSVP